MAGVWLPARVQASDVSAALAAAIGDGTAPGSIERFWSGPSGFATLADPSTYRPLAAARGYLPPALPEWSSCFRSLPPEGWIQNARYCSLDREIAYDATFVADLGAIGGPLAAVVVLAHEWGHHIAALVDASPYAMQKEQVADCFAGAYFGGQVASGALEDHEALDAAWRTWNAGDRDFELASWFDWDVHGTGRMRLVAFERGYLLGAPSCSALADAEPGADLTFGDRFRLMAPPGWTVAADGDTQHLRSGPATVSASWDAAVRTTPDAAIDEAIGRALPDARVTSATQTVGPLEPWGSFAAVRDYAVVDVHGRRSGVAALLTVAISGAEAGGLLILADGGPGASADAAEQALLEVLAGLCGNGEPAPFPCIDNGPPILPPGVGPPIP